MTLQNRVNPFGGLEAVSARGAWTGNRGILHDEHKRIVAQWRNKAWITCRLQFKGIHREVFSPHTWSELFFLDEATAFAAGHRPCAYCRRERYQEFKHRWCSANKNLIDTTNPPISRIDAVLHAERLTSLGDKRSYTEALSALPTGAFVCLDGVPYLLWNGRLLQWTHEGYAGSLPSTSSQQTVDVLTPASIVATFRSGFAPQVHASALY